MKYLVRFVVLGFCLSLGLQAADPQKPSVWWIHAPVTAHLMSAAQDGLSSWKQGEGNSLYVTTTGPQAGHFYRSGAGKLAGITIGICTISEVVGYLKPGWRRYIGAVNLGAAASHVGITTANVIRNPYYR